MYQTDNKENNIMVDYATKLQNVRIHLHLASG